MEGATPKNSILSIKGIIGIVAFVFALAGAITIWSVQDGANNQVTYWSSMLLIATAINVAAYVMGIPAVYAITATIYYVVFPYGLALGDDFRNAPSSSRTKDQKAMFAGMILELIGATLSFFCIPAGGLSFGSIIDLVVLAIVAVFDLIGASIFGDLARVTKNTYFSSLTTSIFIVFAIFAVGIIFAARSVMYCAAVLSTLIWMDVLYRGFNPNRQDPNQRKNTAACVFTFLGMIITAFWVVISLHFLRGDNDLVEGDNEEGHNKTQGQA